MLAAHGSIASVTVSASTRTAEFLRRAYATSVSTAGAIGRALTFGRVAQVQATGIRTVRIARSFVRAVTTSGFRSINHGYSRVRVATVSTVRFTVSHSAFFVDARYTMTLVGRRVRRVGVARRATATTVGLKNVGVRLTQGFVQRATVVARATSGVLRILAQGHSSPGVLTGRKGSSSGMGNRATTGGMTARTTATAPGMNARKMVETLTGRKSPETSITATNKPSGAESSYQVVLTAGVNAKGTTHV